MWRKLISTTFYLNPCKFLIIMGIILICYMHYYQHDIYSRQTGSMINTTSTNSVDVSCGLACFKRNKQQRLTLASRKNKQSPYVALVKYRFLQHKWELHFLHSWLIRPLQFYSEYCVYSTWRKWFVYTANATNMLCPKVTKKILWWSFDITELTF